MSGQGVYEVLPGDAFDQRNYPEVRQELGVIAQNLYLIPGKHKGEIIISFYKDRCIKTEYLRTDQRIVEKVLSGAITGYYTEALFSSCRGNTMFLRDFEQFILDRFSGAV